MPEPARRWGRPLVISLIAVAGLVLLGRTLGGIVTGATARVAALGAWGPAAFVGLYVLACVFAVPGALLTLAAGATFGLARGVALAFAGAMLGSTAAFLLSRHGARRIIERRLGDDPRVATIDRAIAGRGRLIVFLLRLSPVFPFSLLNYALGLTQVRLADFVAGGVGMLPGTLLYVYYGTLIGDVAALAAGGAPRRGPADYALLAVGLAATLAVTVVVTRIARRALEEHARELA